MESGMARSAKFWRSASLVALAAAAWSATPLAAQTIDIKHGTNFSPAAISTIDQNGVNLLTGQLNVQTPVLSMDGKDDPALFYFQWSGRQWFPNAPTISTDEDRHVFVSYPGGSAEFGEAVRDPAYNVSGQTNYHYMFTQLRPDTGASLKCWAAAPVSGQVWLKDCTFRSREGDVVLFGGNEVVNGTYPSPVKQRGFDAFGNMLMWPWHLAPAGTTRSVSYNQGPILGSGTYWDARGAIKVTYDAIQVTTSGYYNNISISFTMKHRATNATQALTFTTSNLNSNNDDNSYLRPKNVTQYVTGPSGTMSFVFNGDGNMTRINYPSGRFATIGYDGDHRVTSYTVDASTWTYSYNFDPDDEAGRTTVTDPLNNTKYIDHASKRGPVTKIKDEENRESIFVYDSYDRLTSAKLPGTGETKYYRNATTGNIETVEQLSTGSEPSQSMTASYPAASGDCAVTSANAKCSRPLSTTKSLNGPVTDYEYGVRGLVTKVTQPPDAAIIPIRPFVKSDYEVKSYFYLDGNGNPVALPVLYRLTKVSRCQTLASCAGTADEVVDKYSYLESFEDGTAANNALPIKIRSELGNGTLLKEIGFTYDRIGNVVATDGPATGDGDKTYAIFDGARRLIYEIGVDPDGTSGPLLRQATHHSYNGDGQETLTRTGTISGIVFDSTVTTIPIDVTGFNPTNFKRKVYHPTYGYLVREEAGTP